MNEKLISGLMDGAYIVSNLLALFGLYLIPDLLTPYLLLPSYLAVFWIYRQVREYGIGLAGRPLLEQTGINIPRFLHWSFITLGFFVYAFFPFYLGVVLAMAFDTGFGDPAHWPAWLKLLTAVLMLFFAGFTWYCLASDRDENKILPEKKKKIYLVYLLPVAAFFLGESSASLADLIHSHWTDPMAKFIMDISVFIPLRLILMRTVGVSAFGVISFLAAVVFSWISKMYM